MAIKEFVIGPQNYFEEGYFSGDYTEPNVSRAFLECDIDLVKGGRFITGEYYLGDYIDGTYYHNNSIQSFLTADAMVVQEASVGLGSYFVEGYYQTGYYEQRGSQFSLTAELEKVGQTVEANGTWETEFTFAAAVTRIQNVELILTSMSTVDTVGVKTVDVNSIQESEFAHAATATRIIDFVISAGALFTPDVSVNVTVNPFAFIEAGFTISSSPVANRSISETLENIANLDAQAARFVGYESIQQVQADLASTATRIRSFDSQQSTSTSLTAVISHIEGADIIAFADSALTTNVEITRSLSSIQQANFTGVFGAGKIHAGNSSLLSNFTINATGNLLKLEFGQASLSSSTAIYLSRNAGTGRPWNMGTPSGGYSTIRQFGTHSAVGEFETIDSNFDSVVKLNEVWVIEAWINFTNYLTPLVDRTILTIGPLTVRQLADGRMSVSIVRSDGTTYTSSASGTNSVINNETTWNHLVICKIEETFNNLGIFWNGTLRYRSTNSANVAWQKQATHKLKFYNPTGWITRVDDLSFAVGTTYGYRPTFTSFTVPTTPRTNDFATTQGLWHFENNGLDDVFVLQTAQAGLVSSATLAALAEPLTKSASANLQSQGFVLSATDATYSVASEMSVGSTLSATAGFKLDSDSALITESTVVVDGKAVFDSIINAGSLFTPSAEANVTVNSFATLEASSTVTALGGKIIQLISPATARRTAKTVTVTGNTFLDTAQSRFGGRSARFDGTNDRLSVASNIDFAFGTGAWTIELWVRLNSDGINQSLIDLRNSTANQQAVFLRVDSSNDVEFTVNGTERIVSNNPSALSRNVWYHIAVTKAANGVHRMFINGVQQTQTWNNTTAYTQGPLNIGERVDGGNDFNGWIDDLRIIKGQALYTAGFTAPTSQLQDIDGTVLLLNMNLVTTNTNFVDTVTLIGEGPLDLASNTTQIAQATKVTTGSLAISANSQLSSTASNLRGFDLDTDSESDLTAESTRIKQSEVDISSTSEFSAEVNRFKVFEINTFVESSVTVSTDRTRGIDSTQASEFTQAIDYIRFRDTTSTQSSEFAQSATAFRIQPGSSDLISTSMLVVDAVKTTDVLVSTTVNVTVNAQAVKTVDSTVNAGALFTPNVDINAQLAGFALLESRFTTTALIGKIIEFEPKVLNGVAADAVRGGSATYQYQPPADPGWFPNVGFVSSIWAQVDSSSPTRGALWSTLTATSSGGSNSVVLRLEYNGTDIRFVYSAPNSAILIASWANARPTDGEWHNYVIRLVRTYPNINGSPTTDWELYVDGVSKGQRTTSDFFIGSGYPTFPAISDNSGKFLIRLGASLTSNSENPSNIGLGLTGGLTQLWIGKIEDRFEITRFYSNGYVELGTDGTYFGKLPQPWIYSPLQDPYTNVNWIGLTGDDRFRASTIQQPDMAAVSLLTVGLIGVALFVTDMTSNFDLVSDGDRVRTGSIDITVETDLVIEVNIQTDTGSDLVSETTQVTDIERFRQGQSTLTSEFDLTGSVRFETKFESDLFSEFTILAGIGFEQQAASDLSSEFVFAATTTIIDPIRSEAALNSITEITATATRIKTLDSSMSVDSDLTADVTVIPPIRIEADLAANFAVSVTAVRVVEYSSTVSATTDIVVEPVVVFGPSFTLETESTVEAQAFKATGIPPTTLQVTGFVLTAGDVINFDPFLTLIIEQETRGLKIDAENRVVSIEQETRLNIIQGY